MADYYQQNQEFNFRRILPIAIVVGALFILVGSWSRMTETIDAGHAGVKFKYFTGLDKETIYGEGFHFLMYCFLIAFERKNVVRIGLDDFPSDLLLAPHCINGHDTPCHVK